MTPGAPRGFAVASLALALGVLVALVALALVAPAPLTQPGVWLLAGGLVATEVFATVLQRPGRRSTLTGTVVWAYAALLVGGVLPAAVLALLGALLSGLVRGVDRWRMLYNLGQLPLSLLAAGGALVALGALPALQAPTAPPLDPADLPAVGVGLVAGWVANQTLMVLGIALLSGVALRQAARDVLGSQRLPALGMIASAPLVAVIVDAAPHLVPLLLVPAVGLLALVRTLRSREHEARHDHLTGLANRARVEEELAEVTAGGEEPAAVLVADLDGFKDVNDTLGHEAGDRVLRIIGQRLRSTLREQDVVARIGGDEFAVVVRGDGAVTQTSRWAERILTRLAEPVVLDGAPVQVSASVGVAVHPRDGDEPAKLLRVADHRMYLRKTDAEDHEPPAGSTSEAEASEAEASEADASEADAPEGHPHAASPRQRRADAAPATREAPPESLAGPDA